MKILTGILAFISSLFIGNSNNNQESAPPPLNTAIISYSETYYAPAVADPGNFPWANKITIQKEKPKTVSKQVQSPPPAAPAPIPPQVTVAPPPPPSTPPPDPYLINPEPIVTWFRYSSFDGSSVNGNERTLPEMTFDREYWRIEVLAYWAPLVTPPKPEVQKDYFKLEVYEKGTDKLIYTMLSGTDTMIHKFQSFRKPGTYYFKIYTQDPSQYEITFNISSKIAAQ